MHSPIALLKTLFLTVLCFVLLVPNSSEACSPPEPPKPFEKDPAASADLVAPPRPIVEHLGTQYFEAESEACTPSGSTCGPRPETWIATVSIRSTDNATPENKMAFEYQVVGGDLPKGLQLPTTPTYLPSGGNVTSFDYQDARAFSVDIQVIAIDANGNRSEPTVFTLSQQGESGCSVPSRRHGATMGWFLVLGALILSVRSRRSKRARVVLPGHEMRKRAD